MRRYLTPRCLGMHLTLLILMPAFAWLTWWQLHRALAGNELSWAYTFEWPLFAGYAVYVWWQLIHDQPTAVSRQSASAAARERAIAADALAPGWALSGGRSKNVAVAEGSAIDETGGRGERFTPQTPEEAAALARYNRYLAQLNAADAESTSR